MDDKKGFLRKPEDINLLNKILVLERDRGMLSDYRREIIGVGCYQHQDISYTVHFQQIDNPDEIMVIPVTDKIEIFSLRESYGFKDKYVYARCTRCPSISNVHNTLSILTVLVVSVFLMNRFIHSSVIYNTMLISVSFWVCGLLITIYVENCKVDGWIMIGLMYWATVVDNFMKWYWFSFLLIYAYINEVIFSSSIVIVGLLWIIIMTQLVPYEISKISTRTTIFHRMMGVRVPYYGSGFPYGE